MRAQYLGSGDCVLSTIQHSLGRGGLSGWWGFGVVHDLRQDRDGVRRVLARKCSKHIEAAYTKMYERYQADLPPDHIYVEPWKAKTPLLM